MSIVLLIFQPLSARVYIDLLEGKHHKELVRNVQVNTCVVMNYLGVQMTSPVFGTRLGYQFVARWGSCFNVLQGGGPYWISAWQSARDVSQYRINQLVVATFFGMDPP